MGYGVTVTQQILVLFFQVRILVVQREAFLLGREVFFCPAAGVATSGRSGCASMSYRDFGGNDKKTDAACEIGVFVSRCGPRRFHAILARRGNVIPTLISPFCLRLERRSSRASA